MSTVTLPASAGQALEMVRAVMDYLATADATQMPVAVQAHCLQTFEWIDAVEIAARGQERRGDRAAGRRGAVGVLRAGVLQVV